MSIVADPEVLASVPMPSGTQQALYLDSVTGLWSTKVMAGTSMPIGISCVGQFINTSMLVTSATSSATFTADQIMVGVSLTGVCYKLGNYSQTLNLSTTGAGGMDTGTATASNFISIYAIYNPSTNTSSILACLASTSISTIYSGSHMPTGYTASALIGIYPTASTTGQFTIGYIRNRKVWIPQVMLINNSNTPESSWTALSLATAIPPGATLWNGYASVANTQYNSATLNISGSSTGIGQTSVAIIASTGTTGAIGQTDMFYNIPIITPQTAYYEAAATAGTVNYSISASSYEF